MFFVYDGVHLDDIGTITVTETNSLPVQLWTRRMPVHGFQVILYDLSCNVVRNYSSDQTGLTINPNGNLIISDVPAKVVKAQMV